MEYTKNCPKCDRILKYSRKDGLNRAIKNNSLCRKCRKEETKFKNVLKIYTKKCLKCKKIIQYSNKKSLNHSIKNNIFCKDCRKEKTKFKKILKIYTRECPKCGGSIKYSNKIILKKYAEKNRPCRGCRKEEEKNKKSTKNCPQCNKVMKYSRKDGLIRAIKNNALCRECCDKNKRISEKEKNIRRKNPIFKMNSNMSSGIRISLKSRNISKNGRHWENLVGYTTQDLKNHLEFLFTEGMNWENMGRGGWHIDHIIPKKFFKYNSADDVEFKYCWSLNNLQPLWEKDNEDKSDKMILWGKEVNAKKIN